MPTPEEMTIPDKLDSLNATKQAIREAIVAKGVEVPEGTTFYEYANLIGEISVGTPAEYVSVTFTGDNKWGAIIESEDGFHELEPKRQIPNDTYYVKKGSSIYMWIPDVMVLTNSFSVKSGRAISFNSATANLANNVRCVIPFSDCTIDSTYGESGGGGGNDN